MQNRNEDTVLLCKFSFQEKEKGGSLEMKKKINWLVKKYGSQLCGVAMLAATFNVTSCRAFFYQPKEPEGLTELLNKNYKED